jgi:hypothetical protein
MYLGLVIYTLCIVIVLGADVEFGGMYQLCDEGKCNPQCMAPNLWTGDCSCPAGYATTCFRVLANGYGTNICFCEPKSVVDGGYYGGAYQVDDNKICGKGCRTANSYLGTCSCIEGYQPSYLRVFVDTQCADTTVGSLVAVCVAQSPGTGNFLGIFQTNQSSECIYENSLAGGCACPTNACAWSGTATIDGPLTSRVSSCTSSLQAIPDPSTVDGKVLFGYQGWFSTPVEKSVGWFHWSKSNVPPSGTTANFDVWPDLSEFGADELYPSALHYSNGSIAGLYTADNPTTILRHFQWMQTYGLDGILLQRFVNEIANPADPHGIFRNNVTQRILTASGATDRVWAIEYDTSGSDPTTIVSVLANDWTYLVKNLGILKSPQYLHQGGKPVVAIWGFGFTGNTNNQSVSLEVINWFKNNGVYVMGGVPYWWRTQTGDSQPNFLNVYLAYDLIMPWAVGRYNDQPSFTNLYNTVAVPDIAYASMSKVAYAPIIFPGFSWANMHGNPSIFNQIPRQGGAFFNSQANTYAKHPGVAFIKIAMFDEVDEGTAMYKAASTKQQTPSDGEFLYLGLDGHPMPSDAYLCLAGTLTANNR